jgi:hypothetical protein
MVITYIKSKLARYALVKDVKEHPLSEASAGDTITKSENQTFLSVRSPIARARPSALAIAHLITFTSIAQVFEIVSEYRP